MDAVQHDERLPDDAGDPQQVDHRRQRLQLDDAGAGRDQDQVGRASGRQRASRREFQAKNRRTEWLASKQQVPSRP
jgi:hypothetical protein